MKQKVEFLQHENNRIKMETESLLSVIELLSTHEINSREVIKLMATQKNL